MDKLQNFVWLWALLAFTIWPAIKQYIATIQRSLLIARIERQRGTKVITMIHRQGSGLLASLVQRYINLDDSEGIMKAVRAAGDKPIDLVLHTPGGLVIAAEQITRVLHAHRPGVTVIVPQYAMSGGTMLALAAKEILLDQHAMLGPIDPQINGYPASGYMRILREKDINAVADETIIMAQLSEQATAQVYQMAFELLRDKLGDEKAALIATQLTEGRWTHDYPLHYEQLREMGLPVSTAIPAEFLDLLSLSSPAQTQAMRKTEPDKKPAKL